MSLWNRRQEQTGPLVYVVSSREEFANWVARHPDNFRYCNIHNEACARGLLPGLPPAEFVILPSANFSVLLRLHTHGFPVENPIHKANAREQEIRQWERKIDLYTASLKSPSAQLNAVRAPRAPKLQQAAPTQTLTAPEPAQCHSSAQARGALRLLAFITLGVVLVVATNGGIFVFAAFVMVVGFIAVIVIGASAEIAEGVIEGHGGQWKSVLVGIVILFIGLVLLFRSCDPGGGGEDVNGTMRPSMRR